MSVDLWPDFNESNSTVEKNDCLNIINQQVGFIEEKTNHVVKASFVKVEMASTLRLLKGVADAVISRECDIITESDDESLSNHKDINDMFSQSRFRFFIYNSDYKFRVFDLLYSEEFPVSISMDEGISNQLGLSVTIEIKKNSELENILRSIFSSLKMEKIIYRMIEDEKEHL